MVFGTFDIIHRGHMSFLRQARRRGRWLIVSVARDRFIREIKGRDPVHTEQQRITQLLETGLVKEAYLADEKIGTYSTVRKARPSIICFGHDQQELRADLTRWLEENKLDIPTCTLKAHKPHRYKSSKIIHFRNQQRNAANK
jgi:cytidyltransferase-like protein